MSHLDPEDLALLAMGEPMSSDAEANHLAECSACADELAVMQHTVLVGRSAIDAGELEAPPEIVWSRVCDELGIAASSPAEQSTIQPGAVNDSAQPVVPAATASVAHTPTRRAAARTQAAPRGRFRRVWALAAAVAVVAGVGLGGYALVQNTAATPVAQAELDAFPDHSGAVGAAVVEEERDGGLAVRVSLESSAAAETYREVWLINGDATALISLGVLDGNEGTFPIPDGVDIRDYVLVDISQEPIDGDPQHSGDSIVRGQLSSV